ncbi:MAG: hypothetical protein AB7F35_01095 [Acetobacteraceae bacterium]
MNEKVLRWIIFGVLVSLVPLAVAYMNLLLKGKNIGLAEVTGKGEVLLICGSLCAGALGELFGSSEKYRKRKIFVGGITLVITLFCTYFFASVEEQLAENGVIDKAALLFLSWLALGLCIVSSISCLILSEAK